MKSVEIPLRTRLRAGDPHAFRELFDAYNRAVYNHAFRLTGDWGDAPDHDSPVQAGGRALPGGRTDPGSDPHPPLRGRCRAPGPGASPAPGTPACASSGSSTPTPLPTWASASTSSATPLAAQEDPRACWRPPMPSWPGASPITRAPHPRSPHRSADHTQARTAHHPPL
jgi:hypothetical protein